MAEQTSKADRVKLNRELAIEFDAIGFAGLFCHGCSLGWHVHCLTEHPIGELGMAKYSVFEIMTRSD